MIFCYIILKPSSYGWNAGIEMSPPLINANALLHFRSRIKQMQPQIIHILRFMW